MVIGEKMFSGAQEGGEGGEGTVKMYGERHPVTPQTVRQVGGGVG
jgi:hypothetical protein